MAARRALVIGLDGYEYSLAESMMRDGRLPHMAMLHDRSARFRLDHGRAKYSGLGWEHFSTGFSPSEQGRQSAVDFDAKTYLARQRATPYAPFLAKLAANTVIFDLPYCDLSKAPRVQGVTNWGAHDPGADRASRPDGLHAEIQDRFGAYPGSAFIYGFCWPSVEKTRTLSEALEKSVDVRADTAHWLLAQRLPGWDLAVIVVSETHSAIEPLWHGVDATHPLHSIPSAAPAREGMLRIYQAVDRLIGRLHQAFPDVVLCLFAMHGMGTNDADIPAMALLTELLYRHSFGQSYMQSTRWAGRTADGRPLLAEHEIWEVVMSSVVLSVQPPAQWLHQIVGLLTGAPHTKSGEPSADDALLDWMPATRYSAFWPRMSAFALPSFYDGRVRINLRGREGKGRIPPARYKAVREEIVEILEECTDPITGNGIIDTIWRPDKDPTALGPDEADLYVIWRSAPTGIVHPRFGTIGPLPYRRTGGHTGEAGFLFLCGSDINPGERPPASSFDVVPMIIDLL